MANVTLKPNLETKVNSVKIIDVKGVRPTTPIKDCSPALEVIFDKMNFEPVDPSSIQLEYRGSDGEYAVYTIGNRGMVLIPQDRVRTEGHSWERHGSNLVYKYISFKTE